MTLARTASAFSTLLLPAAFLGAGPAAAEMARDSFCTQISENDKVASDGFVLTDAGSILRQDRANFHKFGLRDEGDESDRTFRSASARERIPTLLSRGETPRSTLRQIERGTPYICVYVYSRAMFVEIN